ncbi:hypothetical protein PTTG_04830 [Puccinia triticina 1-1 BBBD Race 1]|uniref:DNA primase large subunit C-terminal domain-containing protein n=1 Tax=Puccinia triticina (isolate 1-1 / race 1 (BBBD)) TaxID=630390 RepID=A0A0C4EVJ5_PUCT1|nr:hypothetical protein PTTG_04830 [Puccinia triticina 1-1 BBBD Race 1]
MATTPPPWNHQLVHADSFSTHHCQGKSLRDEEPKKDHYSHFILRLAFCKLLETSETAEQAGFVASLNLDGKELSLALRFVAETSIHIKYIGPKCLIWLGSSGLPLWRIRVRRNLSNQITSKDLAYMDKESRPLLVPEHLSICFLAGISGSDFVTASLNPDGGQLDAAMIDDLAKQHFPPCIKYLWILLQQEKHLEYGDCQQLSLFLKGIQFPMEKAIIFWRQVFDMLFGTIAGLSKVKQMTTQIICDDHNRIRWTPQITRLSIQALQSGQFDPKSQSDLPN